MAQSRAELVEAYTAVVVEIHGAIENLSEFVDSLPAPPEVDSRTPESITWPLVGTLAALRQQLADAMEIIDGLDR